MNNFFNNLKLVKPAARGLALLSVQKRRALLKEIAKQLALSEKQILKVNLKDVSEFLGTEHFRERLAFNKEKFSNLIKSVLNVSAQPEVLEKTLEQKRLPNGLFLKKISVPLGVVGVIYESRPDVTVDLAILAIKSGNGVVLKGGKESYRTNLVLIKAIHKALKKFHISKEAIFLVDPNSQWREVLLNEYGYVDVLIPRGSAQLIEFVRKNAHIPVIETGTGVCHIFADVSCNIKQAVEIIINSKIQRPSVCNALDTLIVHKKVLKRLISVLAPRLATFKVEVFADVAAYQIFRNIYPANLLKKAMSDDFGKEFLSLKMSVKTVVSSDAGIEFVKLFTSGHSESILTQNKKTAEIFLSQIDAAVVYHNASLRFTDGGEFGMGAEVGVSTQKLHARGPMGAMALTSYKWVVVGSGQIRK